MTNPDWTLRRADVCDISRLAAFHADIFRPSVGVWTTCLMSGRHPGVSPHDFVLIEDPHSGDVLSSLAIIRQTWMYSDVPVPVAQVECVGTAAAHRGAGLMRACMDWFTEQARADGCLVGCVQGVPTLYQRLGFHFAVDLKGGVLLTPGQFERDLRSPEKYSPTESDDLADVAALHNRMNQFLVVRAETSVALLAYQDGQPPQSEHAVETWVHRSGTSVGSYLRVKRHARRPGLIVKDLGARTHADLLSALGCAIAFARERGESGVILQLPMNHPAARVARTLGGQHIPPYAWQVRVWNWPSFVTRIAPVLERRLRGSLLETATINVRVNVADEGTGFSLHFDRGDFIQAEPVSGDAQWDLAISSRALVALVFGYRSRTELEMQFLEVRSRPASRAVLDQLFPRLEGFIFEAY